MIHYEEEKKNIGLRQKGFMLEYNIHDNQHSHGEFINLYAFQLNYNYSDQCRNEQFLEVFYRLVFGVLLPR